jgi:hypothetical protein
MAVNQASLPEGGGVGERIEARQVTGADQRAT